MRLSIIYAYDIMKLFPNKIIYKGEKPWKNFGITFATGLQTTNL